MSRCECCDLPLASCGVEAERRQRGQLAAERARLLARADAIPARYAGPCGACGEAFVEGDPITRDGSGRWGQWRALLCCPLALLAAVLVLTGCSITSRDARPETPENLVCVAGHDQVVPGGDGKANDVRFVCSSYAPAVSR